MTRVVYTHQAENELRAIWRLIGAENEAAADRILTAVMDRIDTLRHYPRLGPRRPDIRPTPAS